MPKVAGRMIHVVESEVRRRETIPGAIKSLYANKEAILGKYIHVLQYSTVTQPCAVAPRPMSRGRIEEDRRAPIIPG